MLIRLKQVFKYTQDVFQDVKKLRPRTWFCVLGHSQDVVFKTVSSDMSGPLFMRRRTRQDVVRTRFLKNTSHARALSSIFFSPEGGREKNIRYRTLISNVLNYGLGQTAYARACSLRARSLPSIPA